MPVGSETTVGPVSALADFLLDAGMASCYMKSLANQGNHMEKLDYGTVATAFRIVVTKRKPLSPERETLLDLAMLLAPVKGSRKFMDACGFVMRDSLPGEPSS